MPRRWFVTPWFVVALSVLAAMVATRAVSSGQSRAAQPAPTIKPLPASDASEHLPAIRWYRNEIENTALEVCLLRADQCGQVRTLLKDAVGRQDRRVKDFSDGVPAIGDHRS